LGVTLRVGLFVTIFLAKKNRQKGFSLPSLTQKKAKLEALRQELNK
jgi:hypothetical protein